MMLTPFPPGMALAVSMAASSASRSAVLMAAIPALKCSNLASSLVNPPLLPSVRHAHLSTKSCTLERLFEFLP